MSIEMYAFNITQLERDAVSLPYVRRYYYELVDSKYLMMCGKFFSTLTREEIQQITLGLQELNRPPSEGSISIFGKSVMNLIALIVTGEGCGGVTKEEIPIIISNLAALCACVMFERAGAGKCIYENFQLTGLSKWHVIFVPNPPAEKQEEIKEPQIQ